ncbi:exo-alpha-sialidase [Ramlibacter sp. AW1]|uniref:Exo-alpha-sialidase n=1 Tax=Ramlibacter aurantiacus TaxID=2801330 RepID=A0A936ZTX4_9BURK|nr:sialidase family protein [Ramlibacter aurantiacus]MBL0423423.1 exo-alpha-sialidase [Ramlibacter aurantiacus]
MSTAKSHSRAAALLVRASVFAGLLVAAASPVAALAQLPISSTSTNPDGGDPGDFAAVTQCNGAPQKGVLFRNSESEPHLAVNPTAPTNMIAGWHQDRWSTGGAQSLGAAYTTDGGATWAPVQIPFTRCSGAAARTAGDYERASDPWITFGPDGTAHYMALVTDNTVSENGMVVARSTDGGATWSPPLVIARSPAQDANSRSLFHDKNTITADPLDARFAYATWTVFRTGIVSLVFSRSTNGGLTWSPPRSIATMGAVTPGEQATFRQGAQIVVLPNGTLLNAFYRIIFDNRTAQARLEQAVLRSTDQGRIWTRVDTPVATLQQKFAVDPEAPFIPVRDAGALPSVAASPVANRAYIAWQSTNSQGGVGVYVSVSKDGGGSWETPTRVNQGTTDAVQAFLPTVAVNQEGIVGVLFYDFRNDVLGDQPLSTDVHLSLFDADLNYLGERRLTPQSFDMRMSALSVRGYFPGDYMGLSSALNDFVAAFTTTNNVGARAAWPPAVEGVDSRDRQSIVFVRQTP